MPVVAIVNPKGGVGKTTLATNLAGFFACGGHRTMLATQDFLETLAAEIDDDRRLRERVGIVGMRVDTRTRAADQLGRYVAGLGLPVAGWLRDTQNYVQLSAHGLTLFDVPASRVERDRETWEPLLRWVGR